jgi:hypothetical protein
MRNIRALSFPGRSFCGTAASIFAPQPGKLRRERKAADRPARGATRSWLGRVVFAHFAS